MRAGVITALGALFAMGGSGLADTPVDKYNITPEEHAACDSDAQRLCFATYPDEEKMLDCMRESRPQLTPVCRRALEAGLKRRHLPL